MTRREVCAATVRVCSGPEVIAAPVDSINYVIALKGEVEVHLSSGAVTLNQFDTVLVADASELRVRDDGRAAVVQIDCRS
jgi:hypothetical protein